MHFDVPVSDPQRAITFYSNVFGWKIQKWDGPMEYWLISTGSTDEPGIDGGLYIAQNEERITNLTMGVVSLDDSVVLLEKHGGKVVQPKAAIPGIGWIVYFTDSEGNTFGFMQDDPQAK